MEPHATAATGYLKVYIQSNQKERLSDLVMPLVQTCYNLLISSIYRKLVSEKKKKIM